MVEEIDFQSDSFDDIVAKDSRYAAHAYALLMDVVRKRGGNDILEEFKESALDQYGPLTYRVLTEWGIACTEDVGEMMFNLAEARRIPREEAGTPENFAGGYDFKEVFLGPYEV
ncbi:MAG: hypothetical protein J6R80_04775 [Kiritimatiellae bacterium]|nr:hypothetical protein [Kiritimatiellia bacterium]